MSYLDKDGELKGKVIEKVGSREKFDEVLSPFSSEDTFETLSKSVEEDETILRELSELLDQALQKASQPVSTTAQ